MKKAIIIGAAAFLVSAAAGVGARMALAPPPPAEEAVEGIAAAHADPGEGGAATDARGHGAATEDPASHGTAEPGGSGTHAADPAHATGGREAAAPHASSVSSHEESRDAARAAAGGARTEDAPLRGLEFQEMARVLGGIDPPEAALFLSRLDESIAIDVLRSMLVADAARILPELSPERRSAFREALLAPEGEH